MLDLGTQIKVKAFDIDYQGRGVASYNDHIIFVPHFLIDEEAIIEITKVKKNYYEGKIKELFIKSDDRVESDYSIFGACDLIHFSEDAQDKWVYDITKKSIFKIASIDINPNTIIMGNKNINYRNKSVFHVMKNEYLKFGLFHHSNQFLIEIDSFILSDPLANKIIKSLISSNIKVDFHTFLHLSIRTNHLNQALVTIISKKESFKGLNEVLNTLKKMREVIGVTLNIKENTFEILGKKSKLLYGENVIVEPLGDIEIMIDDRSFYQVNSMVMEKTYDLVKKQIKENATVIDAYSGVGSIGFYLRDIASKIFMIESNPRNVEMAKLTKEKYQIDHIEIVFGKSEDLISQYQADILIVDPPRSGLLESLVHTIINQSFDQIFYLSCDVKTLARDLKLLSKGYVIQSITPIRMFPNTTELETLAVLEKKATRMS